MAADERRDAAGTWHGTADPEATIPGVSSLEDPAATLSGGAVAPRPDLPDLGDRYAAITRVGGGGMGEVWRVHDRMLRRVVLLKWVRTDAGHARGGLEDRLRAEAQLTGQLVHPGLVPVYDVGETPDGRAWYTMREVEGQTLSARMHGPERWPVRRLVEVIRRVADVTSYLHHRGVVHRDLKPDNVMVGEHGEVFVLDLGIARITGSTEDTPLPETDRRVEGRETRVGSVLGTRGFMAPEQAAGLAVDGRADVFSLGRMVGFVADLGDPEETAELRSVAARATEPDPDRRYPTAAAFAEDLAAWMDGLPVGAHRYGWWARVDRWATRHRRALRIAGGVGLLVLATAGFFWAQARTLSSTRAAELAARAVLARGTADDAEARALAVASLQAAERPDARGVLVATTRSWLPRPVARYVSPKAYCRRLDWSPDSTLLACAEGVGVTLLRPPDLEAVRVLMPGRAVGEVVWVDDTRLLVGTRDGDVYLVRAADGAVSARQEDGTQSVEAMAIDPAGAWVVISGESRRLDWLSLPDLSPLAHTGPLADTIWSLVAAPDGTVISSGSEHVVRFWGPAPGVAAGTLVNGLGAHTLALLDAGRRLFTADTLPDRGIHQWVRGPEGWSYSGSTPNTQRGIWGLAASADGHLLASAGVDGSISLRDGDSGGVRARVSAHTEDAFDVRFSPDLRWLASSSWDASTRLWDLSNPSRPDRLAGVHTLVRGLTVWGDRVGVALADGAFGTWDLESCLPVGPALPAEPDRGLTTLTSADGERIVKVYAGVGLQVIDAGVVGPVRPLPPDLAVAPTLDLDPGGRRLFLADVAGGWGLLDLDADRWARGRLGAPVAFTALAADGRVLVGDGEGTVQVLSPEGALLRERRVDGAGIFAAAAPPAGPWLLGTGSGTVIRVDPDTLAELDRWRADERTLGGLAVSPDGRHVATGTWDGRVRVWSAADHTLRAEWSAHAGRLTGLVFGGDALLVTGGWDATVRVWDLADLARPVADLASGVVPEGDG